MCVRDSRSMRAHIASASSHTVSSDTREGVVSSFLSLHMCMYTHTDTTLSFMSKVCEEEV